MLAVVYLVAAKKCFIIPQEWIMALSQETLNNIGKASYQSRHIFWSNVGVDTEEIPDTTIAPNFSRTICSIFPPTENEVCYIVRVKCYCANLVRAKYFRDTFRAQLPVLYNARKKFDAPLPEILLPLSSNVQNTNDPGQSLAGETSVVQPENETSIDPVAVQLIDRNEPDSSTESLPANSNSNSNANANVTDSNGVDEVKCVMPNVELNEADSLAILHVFDDEQLDDVDDTEDEASGLYSTETTFQEEGVLKVKIVYGEDCEMICPHGVKLMPKNPLYHVKLNDPISMNIPYKENVSLFKLASSESFQKKLHFKHSGKRRSSIFGSDKK